MMATSDFRLWSVAVSPAKKIQIPDSKLPNIPNIIMIT
jgi:hypothetical protein